MIVLNLLSDDGGGGGPIDEGGGGGPGGGGASKYNEHVREEDEQIFLVRPIKIGFMNDN